MMLSGERERENMAKSLLSRFYRFYRFYRYLELFRTLPRKGKGEKGTREKKRNAQQHLEEEELSFTKRSFLLINGH